MAGAGYDASVFINCPFDADYATLFDAIVFAVHDCGFVARYALEIEDGSQVRIAKLTDLIARCRLGVHDLSRTELSPRSGLPRFNMPLELGLFLGAKRYGDARQRRKLCLVLDREPYRYQQFCSDIAGQDISAHDGKVEAAIKTVRDWLRNARVGSTTIIPSGSVIFSRYERFGADLPALCGKLQLDPAQLIFNDRVALIIEWLKANPR